MAKIFRKLLVQLHFYIGISVGAVLVVSGITGSLLVFGRDIDKSVNAHLTSVPIRESRASLSAIESDVKDLYPDASIPYINMPRVAGESIEFYLSTGETFPIVYADPYTGAILGVRDQHSMLFEWIFAIHTGDIGGETGEWVVGTGAIVLLLLSLSGIYLWFPGRRKLRRGFRINTRNGTKRMVYDIHSVVGFYASVLLVLTSVSAIYLIFHDATASFINLITFSPSATAPSRTEPQKEPGKLLALDDAVDIAQKALPGSQISYILPPTEPDVPFAVRAKLPEEWHPNGRSVVYLNQNSGEILHIENALNAPLGTRIANALYPLHIGVVGGTANRVVQLFLGLVPALLYVTGFWMWYSRRKRRAVSSSQKSLVQR